MSVVTTKLNTLLGLKRPLCIIDIETTGVNVENDRIVELTIAKISLDGKIETKTKRFNPEIPIPKDATEVHGITNEDVANEPTFKQVAKAMLTYISGCDFAGYSSNRFDLPLLNNEFLRAGVNFDYNDVKLIDVCNIFMRNEGRTLTDAYRLYCGKELENAHQSATDALATMEVLEKQLEMYETVPKDLSELDFYSNYDKKRIDLSGKFSYDDDGDIIFNFGKEKGKKALNEKKYLEWMRDKGVFSSDVIYIVNKLLEKIKEQELA